MRKFKNFLLSFGALALCICAKNVNGMDTPKGKKDPVLEIGSSSASAASSSSQIIALNMQKALEIAKVEVTAKKIPEKVKGQFFRIFSTEFGFAQLSGNNFEQSVKRAIGAANFYVSNTTPLYCDAEDNEEYVHNWEIGFIEGLTEIVKIKEEFAELANLIGESEGTERRWELSLLYAGSYEEAKRHVKTE